MPRTPDLFNTRPATPEENARLRSSYEQKLDSVLKEVEGSPVQHQGGLRSQVIMGMIDLGYSPAEAAQAADHALAEKVSAIRNST